MKYWFTSDMHLGHANIIEFTDRPFKDIEDMNSKLIANWNARVKPNDTIFHLGDFCFHSGLSANSYLKKLNGNVILIKGNHDGNNGVNSPILDMRIYYGGENLLLVHNPSDVTCFGGKLVLCGHVHTAWKFKREYYKFPSDDTATSYTDFCNVGVDQWNFHPISINEILKEYLKWKKENGY